jgi:acetyl-CoA acetyltransferase
VSQQRLALVGVGQTPSGRLEGYDALELHALAAAEALEDAQITAQEVDGLLCCGSVTQPFPAFAVPLAERLGIRPALCLTVQAGGASQIAAVATAARAVASGEAHNVLAVFADATLSQVGREGMVSLSPTMTRRPEEEGYGFHIPAQYALVASRWHHEYGRADGCLAPIAVAARAHAARHPLAYKRDPITVADVLASPMISSPLRRLECSVVSDGGSAVVMRRSGGQPGTVELLGYGESLAWWNVSQARSLTENCAAVSMRAALNRAGVTPGDLDFACLYDSFSISVAVQLEGIGLCGPGEAPDFVAEVGIGPGSGFPVNPHGGLLSFGHPGYPGGMNQIVEAVRQLRRDADGRQIPDAEVALAHGVLGPMSYHSSVVLGRR